MFFVKRDLPLLYFLGTLLLASFLSLCSAFEGPWSALARCWCAVTCWASPLGCSWQVDVSIPTFLEMFAA